MQETFNEVIARINVIVITPQKQYITIEDAYALMDAHIADMRAKDKIIKVLNEQKKQE